MENSDKKFYRQSEINMFLRCAKQWAFRYLEEIIKPPKAAATVGTAVHAGVAHNLEQKIDSDKDLPIEDVTDATVTEFNKKADDTEWENKLEKDQSKDLSVTLVKLHHREFAPSIKPKLVEQKLEVDFEDKEWGISGTLDCLEQDNTLVDTKTSARKYDETAARRAIQPTLYTTLVEGATGERPTGFRYDVLIKPTVRMDARVQSVHERITRGDQQWLINTIDQVHKSIKADVFPPAPEGTWWCTDKWCAYWDICKGRK